MANTFDSVACMRAILMNEGIEEEEILTRTPERWVEALRGFLGKDAEEFTFTTFESKATDMVIEMDIPFRALCAHHLLPFFGVAHVAYIPQGRVAGLSKLARVVTFASMGLWSQEELCEEVMHQLVRGLSHTERCKRPDDFEGKWDPSDYPPVNVTPRGVAVVMKATHTCMSTRGAKAVGATTITSAMCGVFRENGNGARSELMSLIK